MTYDDFRAEMANYRLAIINKAVMEKEANNSFQYLRDLFDRFDENEWGMAERVLVQWLQSDDSSLRRDALYLVDGCRVVSALSAVKELAERLSKMSFPKGRFEEVLRTDELRKADEVREKLEFVELYERSDSKVRHKLDQELIERLHSNDYWVRSRALVLIHFYKIASAIRSLQELQARLGAQIDPMAQSQLRKVRSVLAEMTAES